jgi:hypothetical protein
MNWNPMNWKKCLKEGTALLALISLGIFGAATLAESGKDDDVVVKKNSDGTVDVSDAPRKQAAPAARHAGRGSSEPQQVNIHYRLKNDVGTRHINGVSVTTNSDGSIETSDGESSPQPIHHSTTHHSSAHAKPAVKHK